MSGSRILSCLLFLLAAQALDDNHLIQHTIGHQAMLATTNSASEVFEHMDANHDGDISQTELEQAMGHAGPDKATKRVAVVDMTSDVLKGTDTNHDGIISRDELQQAIRDIFERADANNDGVISRAELQQVLTTLGHRETQANKPKSQIDGKKTAAHKAAAHAHSSHAHSSHAHSSHAHADKVKSQIDGKKTAAHKAAAHAQSSQEHVDKVKSHTDGNEMAAHKAGAHAQSSQEQLDKVKSKVAGQVTAAHKAAADADSPQAAAQGDPHCRNLKGESFDIRTTGQMTMLQVPGFRITAKIGHIHNHDSCSPTVIKEVTIGGSWLGRGDEEMTVTPGDHGMPLVPASWRSYFKSESVPPSVSLITEVRRTSSNSEIFVVKMKVFQTVILLLQRRGTKSGVDYFDMRVRKIASLGKDIGGLLGNDPHDVESAPSLQCLNANSVARLNDAGTAERGSTSHGMMSVAWVE